MSALERAAAKRVIAQAKAAGVPVSPDVVAAVCRPSSSAAASAYAEAHPDGDGAPVEMIACCIGAAVMGLEHCTCWEPVWEIEQAEHLAIGGPHAAQKTKCQDCAFRRDSPERADEWMAEELYALAGRNERFWCHSMPDGQTPAMLRAREWRHPSGAIVPGSTADWQPPIVDGVPYRLDGTPAWLCAGWTALHAAAQARP